MQLGKGAMKIESIPRYLVSKEWQLELQNPQLELQRELLEAKCELASWVLLPQRMQKKPTIANIVCFPQLDYESIAANLWFPFRNRSKEEPKALEQIPKGSTRKKTIPHEYGAHVIHKSQ